MYFWKCWRCSRTRLFYALIVVVLLFGLSTFGTVKVSELEAKGAKLGVCGAS